MSKAFTMIELIFVIVIIAILAVVVIPAANNGTVCTTQKQKGF